MLTVNSKNRLKKINSTPFFIDFYFNNKLQNGNFWWNFSSYFCVYARLLLAYSHLPPPHYTLRGSSLVTLGRAFRDFAYAFRFSPPNVDAPCENRLSKTVIRDISLPVLCIHDLYTVKKLCGMLQNFAELNKYWRQFDKIFQIKKIFNPNT